MSILSDILSRAKQQQPKRDVPPGLRSTVSSIKLEESRRRKMFLLATVIVLFTGLGFATLYLTDIYGTGKGKGIQYQGRRGPQSVAPGVAPPIVEAKKEAVRVSPGLGEARKPPVARKPREIAAPSRPQAVVPVERAAPPAAVAEPQKVEQPSQPHPQQTARIHEEPSPGLKEAYIYTAEGHENSGELNDAVSDYRKVLELEPDNYRVMNKIASIFIRMGRLDDAEKSLKSALRIRPDYLPALINSGIASAKAGKNAEAEAFLIKAVTTDGASRAALLNIALLYEKERKYDQARDYFSRLRKLGDNNGELGLQRLETAGQN